MWGDDRPDHGLARIRQGREYDRLPLLVVRHTVVHAEKRLSEGQRRRLAEQFSLYLEVEKVAQESFRARLRNRMRSKEESKR